MGKQIRKQKKSSIIAGGFFRFALYLCVIVGVIYIGKSAYDFGYEIFNQEAMDNEENGRDVTVVIKEGDSVYQIGKTLKKKGLIDDAKIFVAQEMLSSYKGKLQPGTYILSTSMTPDEMMEIWSRRNTERTAGPDKYQEEKQKKGSSEIQDGSSSSPKETDESSQDEGGEQS